jgi:hypothetical protein
LFSDIAKEDTCLDPDCFNKKKTALVQIQIGKLEEKGLQAARISNSLRVGAPGEKADVLYRGEYRIVERDSCAFAQPGVYDEGVAAENPIYICNESSCPVHTGRTKFSSPEEQKVRKARGKDQREEKRYRQDLLAAVRDKVSKSPQKAELYLVASRFLQLMPHENRVATSRVFNWTETKSPGKRGGKHVDYVELGKKELAKLGTYELLRFLIVASLTPDLSIPDSDPKQTLPTTSALAQTAKRLGIVPKTVRAGARKALKDGPSAS